MAQTEKKEILWINAAKFIAIFAVVIDHTAGILYHSDRINMSTFFAVALFILLAGMTAYSSTERKLNQSYFLVLGRRLSAVIIPYMVAVAVYMLVLFRPISIGAYFSLVWSFNAASPFYFIWIYIQLLFIARPMYLLISHFKPATLFGRWRVPSVMHWVMLIIIVCVSALSMRYTYTKDLSGGGPYLFGASFLIFYYCGMLFAHIGRDAAPKSSSGLRIGTSIFALLVFLWLIFMFDNKLAIDAYFPFGVGRNPPSFTIGVYTLLVAGFISNLFTLLERSKVGFVRAIANGFSWLGKYSWDIFVYHVLCLHILHRNTSISNPILITVVYLVVMIGAPICGRLIYTFIKQQIIKIGAKKNPV